jgi:hypothetical protein
MQVVPVILLTEADISDEAKSTLDQNLTRLVNRTVFSDEELLDGISQVLISLS